MKRSPLMLALALSFLLPAAALAKNPTPPKPDANPKPLLTEQQAQALNKCMMKCQRPMKSCMDDCKGDNTCNMKCGTHFSECINNTCGDLLPEPPKEK